MDGPYSVTTGPSLLLWGNLPHSPNLLLVIESLSPRPRNARLLVSRRLDDHTCPYMRLYGLAMIHDGSNVRACGTCDNSLEFNDGRVKTLAFR
jgi:hypothetical protein